MKRVIAKVYLSLLATGTLAFVIWGLAQSIGWLNAAAMMLGAASAAAMMLVCLYWLKD
jgi:hypothetical protein